MIEALAIFVLLVIAAGVVVLAVAHAQVQMLLQPPRMTDGKAMYVLRRMSPADLGLPFGQADFTVRDGASHGKPLRIAGWWIEAAAPSSRTCVLVHGFADAKVGALAWAPLWRSLGWNVLLIDLRAHGESGGALSTGGFYERDDLDAVLNDLRARWPAKAQQLALFGVSLGGAVVLATAARRNDIDAVIADGVFADYRDAAIVHGRLIGAPLPSATPFAIRWAERQAAARFDEVRPVTSLKACACPVMLVHGGMDEFVPDDHVAALAEALHARGNDRDVHFRIPDAGHCLGIVANAAGYTAQLRAFLERMESSAITSSGEASTRA